jgi:hypothetical protein
MNKYALLVVLGWAFACPVDQHAAVAGVYEPFGSIVHEWAGANSFPPNVTIKWTFLGGGTSRWCDAG